MSESEYPDNWFFGIPRWKQGIILAELVIAVVLSIVLFGPHFGLHIL